MSVISSIVLGFIAGAIATLTAYELLNWVFLTHWTGWDSLTWNMAPAEYLTLPPLLNTALWGGLWGAIVGLILGPRPRGLLTFRGALLGIVFPAVLGAFILVPVITGRYPPFFGGDASQIIPALCLMAAWGAVTAWVYGLFRFGHLPGFGAND